MTDIGLGCWQFGGAFGFWTGQRRTDSIKVIHAALRCGIRHFDTAQGYGNGYGEQLLGQQLKRFSPDIGRSEYTVATKIMPKTPALVAKDVGKSLRRLCTDHLDILYLHWPSETAPLEAILDAMEQHPAVTAIGICNTPPELLETLTATHRISYLQIPCSLLWTRNLATTRSFCRKAGIALVGYSPLGMGTLTRSPDDPIPSDARSGLYCYAKASRLHFDTLLSLLGETAAKHRCRPASVALAWALGQDFDLLLTGARTKEQLTENLGASSLVLTDRERQDLSACAARLSDSTASDQDNIFDHRWR